MAYKWEIVDIDSLISGMPGTGGGGWGGTGDLVGGGDEKMFLEMNAFIAEPYLIGPGRNALTVGPVLQTATVTVSDGAAWVIV
jgi:hypothetical protein